MYAGGEQQALELAADNQALRLRRLDTQMMEIGALPRAGLFD
jgi:hypothetical protein